jgi:hypothetical protein
MGKDDFNIISSVRMIESLKAELISIIGDLFKLMNRGTNVAKDSIIDCISGAMIILYILADRLGYSYQGVDDNIKAKLKTGIIENDDIELKGKDLSKLYTHFRERN